jgi:hypothetical protein
MEKENVAVMISLQKNWRSSNKRGEIMNSTNKNRWRVWKFNWLFYEVRKPSR